MAGGAQQGEFTLGLLRGRVLFQVLGQAVFVGDKEGLAQDRQPRWLVKCAWHCHSVCQGKSIDHRLRSLLGCPVGFPAQGPGPGQPANTCIGILQCGGRLIQLFERRKYLLELLHRRIDNSAGVGQTKLDAFGERYRQGFLGLKTPVLQHHRLEIGLAMLVCGQGQVKTPPDQRGGGLIILQQFVVERQVEPLQNCQRRGAQQRREPAMEGTDLHLPPALQHTLVQLGELPADGLQTIGPLAAAHAPRLQLGSQHLVRRAGKLVQPLVQPLAHLAGRAFGKGNRENLVRRHTQVAILRVHAVQQGPHDTRHQHPGLARAGAGLDGHAAARIAGDCVKAVGRDGLAVVFVRRLAWDFRHTALPRP